MLVWKVTVRLGRKLVLAHYSQTRFLKVNMRHYSLSNGIVLTSSPFCPCEKACAHARWYLPARRGSKTEQKKDTYALRQILYHWLWRISSFNGPRMQIWSIKLCWLLLGLLSSVYARPQYIARTFLPTFYCTQILTFITDFRGVQAGPYHIYNCGTKSSLASILINTLITTLQPVLDDLTLHTSSDAYTTFFKNVALAPRVYDLLSNIKKGTPIPPGPHGLTHAPPSLFGPPATPQFVCVTDYNQITWSVEAGGVGGKQADAFTACEKSPVNAFGVFGSKYLRNTIVLCPAFWSYPDIPQPSTANCLTVDPLFNRFRESGKRLINYQLWVIMHELVHSYVYARSGSLSELSSVNDCVSLAAGSSVINAQNYVFYAASKCSITRTGYLSTTRWSRSTSI